MGVLTWLLHREETGWARKVARVTESSECQSRGLNVNWQTVRGHGDVLEQSNVSNLGHTDWQ